MAVYKKYNDKTGFDYICHTATGYRCLSKIINPDDLGKQIYFFAKHIVGKDGRPYTEIGFECSESFAKRDYIERVKSSMLKAGFKEIYTLANYAEGELAFTEFATPYPNSIEFRVAGGEQGVTLCFDALSDMLSKEAINFVHDQESDIENILFESIMESMGSELSKGPGGTDRAIKKARELTEYFIHGIKSI